MTTAHAFPSGTVTMLFTDIEGSTRLLKQLGERYGEVLADHRRILREAFAEYGGREMDTQGDAFFVVFARARGAVGAAVAAQRALAAHEWPDGIECRVRMGLHTGEPEVGDEGYHGMGLHRGARIAAAGHGGQILLSNTTRELVEDDLPAGARLRDLGEQRLKDIDRPERIYQLEVEGLPSEFPPLKTSAPAATVLPRRSRRRLVTAVAVVVLLAGAVAGGIVLATGGGSKQAAAAGEVAADSVGIFSPESGRLTGQIPVGASPGDVTAGFASVWVSNVNAHTVSRVDPIKGVTIQTIQVGNGPDGIAVGGGFVWVANGLDGTVTKISPVTDSVVDTISVGNGPAGVAANGRYVWVANASDGTVTRIDERTDNPGKAIPVGQSADGIAVGDGAVWVTSEVSGTLTKIDGSTIVQSVATGSGADAVAAGHDAIWVANSLDGTVTRVDPSSQEGAVTIAVGDGPSGIAVTANAVWVSNDLSGTLSLIDPERNVVVRSVKTGNQPEGIVIASGQLFVAVRASGVGHRGGTLTVLTPGVAFTKVDPAAYYSNTQVLALTNDGLTGFRRVGGPVGARVVNDLAVSLPAPTDGGRLYSFQLRSGIHYSTGALVRPEDFRQGIERTLLLDPAEGGYFARILGAPRCLADRKKPCDLSKGIVTDDASNTVTFHLTAPDPDFLSELALPSAYAVPTSTPLRLHTAVPATGPYEIASYDAKGDVRLVRNPRFREWSPAAQPSGFPNVIVEQAGGSPDSHIRAVLSGSADLATDGESASQALLDSVRTQHASQLEVNPSHNTWFLVLNTRVPPFNDLRARQALNFAVDRQQLRDLTLGQGLGEVTCQILPPNFYGYQRYCPYTAAPGKSGVWTSPDLARARALVRASGTAGQSVTVWMPPWIPFAKAPGVGGYLVSVLDSLGYKAHYRAPATLDPFQHEDELRVQAGFYAWGPDFASPASFIGTVLTCGVSEKNGNTARFCDPAIDREIARAQALQPSDPDAASLLWAKIDRDVTDQAPWVPFANGVGLEVVSTRLGNYESNPQYGTLLDQLWVR